MSVSRYVRGSAFASPCKSYVRVQIEGQWGALRAEVYVTTKQARELRDSLDQILVARSARPKAANS